MLLNTFLEAYNLTGKTIIPFCTSGGYPIDKSIEVLKESAPQAHWQEGLRITGNEKQMRAWLARVGVLK